MGLEYCRAVGHNRIVIRPRKNVWEQNCIHPAQIRLESKYCRPRWLQVCCHRNNYNEPHFRTTNRDSLQFCPMSIVQNQCVGPPNTLCRHTLSSGCDRYRRKRGGIFP